MLEKKKWHFKKFVLIKMSQMNYGKGIAKLPNINGKHKNV